MVCHDWRNSATLSLEEVRKANPNVSQACQDIVVWTPRRGTCRKSSRRRFVAGTMASSREHHWQMNSSDIEDSRGDYQKYPTDGKYISIKMEESRLLSCQSHAKIRLTWNCIQFVEVNPQVMLDGGTMGYDATNRKFGSDMMTQWRQWTSRKGLSKHDVSINIHAFLKANKTGATSRALCVCHWEHLCRWLAILGNCRGKRVTSWIRLGGFEKLAEWGLF